MAKVTVHTDSSAAKSLASRKGFGKARHIEVTQLWVQETVSEGLLELRKVKGTEKPADLFTKHLPSAKGIEETLGRFGSQYRDGRPDNAPATTPRS